MICATRVAWPRCCVAMSRGWRLTRNCNMVTQKRDHATRQLTHEKHSYGENDDLCRN